MKKCPICGNLIKGYSALSRKDNKTEICSECATKEALDLWLLCSLESLKNQEVNKNGVNV